MFLPGSRGQPALANLISFDGTITSGGTAQLLLPQQPGRSYLFIQNLASQILTVGVGPATGTASISSGKVSSISVGNAGVGYTVAPMVILLGGLVTGDLYNAPGKPAVAYATLSGTTIGSITVADGGSGYLVAPTVLLHNPPPSLGGGAFVPSATAGITLAQYGTLVYENTFCPPDAVAVFGATTSNAFVCKTAF